MKSTVRRLLTSTAIVLTTATLGFSDPTFWFGGTGSVTNVANWDNGLPDNTGTNTGVVFDGKVLGGGNDFNSKMIAVYEPAGVEITSDLTLTDGAISLINNAGLLANGSINITVGSGVGGSAYIGVSDTAQLIMPSGNLTIGGDSNGTIEQDGGTVQLQNGLLTLGKNSNAPGIGVYQLSGGTLQVNDITYVSVNSFVDLSSTGNGVLAVSTNNYSIANAEANISTGNIRLDGVAADKSLFSITEEGDFIKVQAIPEPAVIGLIGIGGLGVLISRRISKKQPTE